MKTASVYYPGDHLTHVVLPPIVGRDDAVNLRRVVDWWLGSQHLEWWPGPFDEILHDIPGDGQCVLVVGCEMVGDTGYPCVYIGASQGFGVHLFTGGGQHQRWPGQEYGPLPAYYDHFVTHGRDVSPPGRARTHDHGHLRDALGGHLSLIIEDAPKVIPVWKHLGLQGQKSAARVHQVDARQAVSQGDFLGPKVFLNGYGIITAAFHSGIVG